MKLNKLKDIIQEAYFEVLIEAAQPPVQGPKRDQTDPTLNILGKFPTLQKTLTHLLTPQYMQFVENIVAPYFFQKQVFGYILLNLNRSLFYIIKYIYLSVNKKLFFLLKHNNTNIFI